MRVSFIRHASLQKPFDNYDNLSFEEIDGLARGSIDPDINAMSQEGIKKTLLSLNAISDNCVILFASSKRAKQTAKLIQKIINNEYNKQTKLAEFDALNEIYFEPKKMIDLDTYQKTGLSEIRNVMFSHISGEHKNSGVENVNSILKRVKTIEEKVKKLSEQSNCVICVTHGFLMRVLQLYFSSGIRTKDQITKDILYKMANFPNSTGFSTDIKN